MPINSLPDYPLAERGAVSGVAAIAAMESGWVVTEVGRQPWVVYHVMRTSQAVTSASALPIGYATLALIYAGVAVGVVWILRRLAAVPLSPARAASPVDYGG